MVSILCQFPFVRRHSLSSDKINTGILQVTAVFSRQHSMFQKFFANTKLFFHDSLRMHRTAFRYVPFQAWGIIATSALSSISGFLIIGSTALLVNALVAFDNTGVVQTNFSLIIVFVIGSLVLPDFLSLAREHVDRAFWLRLGTELDILFLRARVAVDINTHERAQYQDTLGKATDRGIYPILNTLDSQYAMLGDAVTLVIASIVLLRIDPLYLGLLALGILPRLFVGVKYSRNVWTLYDLNAEDRRKFYFLRSFPDESHSLMESHLLGLRETIVGRLRNLADVFMNEQLIVERKKTFWSFIAALFFAVVLVVVYGMTIQLVFVGGISVGGFVFLSSSVGRFSDPFQRIILGVSRQYEFALFAREIFAIIDTAPSVQMAEHPRIVSESQPPEIVFEHVSFHYPDIEQEVLSDINLRIPSGTSLAIVGVNGAGKTTLVKLLARFYDPTDGRIFINGIDLREVDLVSWYSALAVLFQHFPTYQSFTVSEGIALGNVREAKDQKAVRLAAEEAGADVFIGEWKLAYEQVIGKQFTDGVDPSRGQEQRLALARMFYRNAKCLVLDEPTASVDAESEVRIFHTIEEMKGKTRILISHRFSTVKNADQICVLDGGNVRELGTHTELMAQNGEYARLFRMQASGYKEDGQSS